MADVQRLVVERLAALYGDPRTGDMAAFIGEWHRALSSFDNATLERATSMAIDENEYRSWPALGVVRKHCEAFRPVPNPPAPSSTTESLERQAAKRKAADWLLNTDQGRDALRGHYARPLWSMLTRQFEREPHSDTRAYRFADSDIAYFARTRRRVGYLADLLVMFQTQANVDRIIERLDIAMEDAACRGQHQSA